MYAELRRLRAPYQSTAALARVFTLLLMHRILHSALVRKLFMFPLQPPYANLMHFLRNASKYQRGKEARQGPTTLGRLQTSFQVIMADSAYNGKVHIELKEIGRQSVLAVKSIPVNLDGMSWNWLLKCLVQWAIEIKTRFAIFGWEWRPRSRSILIDNEWEELDAFCTDRQNACISFELKKSMTSLTCCFGSFNVRSWCVLHNWAWT